MSVSLTDEQAKAKSVAVILYAQWDMADDALRDGVRLALKAGVPILTLANALGVSRTRIRTLARGGDSR